MVIIKCQFSTLVITQQKPYINRWRFDAFLLETDSKPQISIMVNVCFYKYIKLTLNWSHIFDDFYTNYDSIIVSLKSVKITNFSAAL